MRHDHRCEAELTLILGDLAVSLDPDDSEISRGGRFRGDQEIIADSFLDGLEFVFERVLEVDSGHMDEVSLCHLDVDGFFLRIAADIP